MKKYIFYRNPLFFAFCFFYLFLLGACFEINNAKEYATIHTINPQRLLAMRQEIKWKQSNEASHETLLTNAIEYAKTDLGNFEIISSAKLQSPYGGFHLLKSKNKSITPRILSSKPYPSWVVPPSTNISIPRNIESLNNKLLIQGSYIDETIIMIYDPKQEKTIFTKSSAFASASPDGKCFVLGLISDKHLLFSRDKLKLTLYGSATMESRLSFELKYNPTLSGHDFSVQWSKDSRYALLKTLTSDSSLTLIDTKENLIYQ